MGNNDSLTVIKRQSGNFIRIRRRVYTASGQGGSGAEHHAASLYHSGICAKLVKLSLASKIGLYSRYIRALCNCSFNRDYEYSKRLDYFQYDIKFKIKSTGGGFWDILKNIHAAQKSIFTLRILTIKKFINTWAIGGGSRAIHLITTHLLQGSLDQAERTIILLYKSFSIAMQLGRYY